MKKSIIIIAFIFSLAACKKEKTSENKSTNDVESTDSYISQTEVSSITDISELSSATISTYSSFKFLFKLVLLVKINN